MPLTLTLDPHGEQLLAQHLRTGRYSSPEEVVTRALETLSEQPDRSTLTQNKKTVSEAISHIREARKGVILGGLTIKDLIQEGHKYRRIFTTLSFVAVASASLA
jgi:Arc/MetJ-type ribon-helix-helix transcriptional regulator